MVELCIVRTLDRRTNLPLQSFEVSHIAQNVWNCYVALTE